MGVALEQGMPRGGVLAGHGKGVGASRYRAAGAQGAGSTGELLGVHPVEELGDVGATAGPKGARGARGPATIQGARNDDGIVEGGVAVQVGEEGLPEEVQGQAGGQLRGHPRGAGADEQLLDGEGVHGRPGLGPVAQGVHVGGGHPLVQPGVHPGGVGLEEQGRIGVLDLKALPALVGEGTEAQGTHEPVVLEVVGPQDLCPPAPSLSAEQVHLHHPVPRGDVALEEDRVVQGARVDVRDPEGVGEHGGLVLEHGGIRALCGEWRTGGIRAAGHQQEHGQHQGGTHDSSSRAPPAIPGEEGEVASPQ